MSKPAVLRDPKLQAEFDKNGFVKIRIFTAEQVNRLHDYYLKTQTEHETIINKKKFHSTNDTDNADLISIVDSFIKEVMFEIFGELPSFKWLIPFKVGGFHSAFFYKKKD